MKIQYFRFVSSLHSVNTQVKQRLWEFQSDVKKQFGNHGGIQMYNVGARKPAQRAIYSLELSKDFQYIWKNRDGVPPSVTNCSSLILIEKM